MHKKLSFLSNQKFRDGLRSASEAAKFAVHLTSSTTPLGKAAVVLGGVGAVLSKKSTLQQEMCSTKELLTRDTRASYLFFETLNSAGKLVPGTVETEITEFRLYDDTDPKLYVSWLNTRGEIHGAYVEPEHKERSRTLIGRALWETLGTRVLINFPSSPFDKLELTSDPFITQGESIFAQTLHERVLLHHKKGYSRSVLLHGPPGTGKSYIARHVAYLRGGFSLRAEGTASQLESFISILRPKTVIIDDIDRKSSRLDDVELAKQQGALVIATANQTEKLDPALLRPGRFDEIYHIQALDREVFRRMLPDADDSIIDRVAKIPIAFIEEYRIALEVEGPEKALERLSELEERAQRQTEPETSPGPYPGSRGFVYIE